MAARLTYVLVVMLGYSAVFLQGCGGVESGGVCKTGEEADETMKKCESADEKCLDAKTAGACSAKKECTCQKGVPSGGVCKIAAAAIETEKECQIADEKCLDKETTSACTVVQNECTCQKAENTPTTTTATTTKEKTVLRVVQE
eukprot:GEMP01063444.1.p1 GENE.GEMP01063444.1~~GEMP01063444.1.p1  ORF type:complete len:169 (+),score=35.01 GEMP01063444.1:77-508(+)